MNRSMSISLLALLMLNTSAFAEWSRISGPRVSGPRGSSLSGARDARKMNRDEKEILENSTCVWVDAAEDDAEEVREVVGYQVANCQDPETGGPSILCSGTARCNAQLTSGGEKTPFTLYVGNVMCRSKLKRSCPTARECLVQGGALAEYSIEGGEGEIPHANDKIRYAPGKQPVKGKTH